MITPQKVISQVFAYKFLIISLIAILAIGGGLFEARKYLIDKTKVAKIDNSSGYVLGDSSDITDSNISPDQYPPTDTPTPNEDNVLGTSTNLTNNNSGGESTLLTVTPFPTMIPNPTAVPTLVPLPTIVPNLSTPTPTPNPTQAPSPHSCAGLNASPGQPTNYYSEASSAQTVNDTATITVQLFDCNNKLSPVNETLNISQSSGPNTTVNGDSPPISIETSNGQTSFIVKSQTSGTAVYVISLNSNFPDGGNTVTAPGYKNPQVTFTTSAPTSTPSPTLSVTQTPTPTSSANITPTITITVSPTISPNPSVTITISPTPTNHP